MFGGASSLKRNFDYSDYEAKRFMNNTAFNQIHKQVKYKTLYKRMHHITAPSVGYLQADLMDVSNWTRANNGHSFILVVVDVYSRYAWAFPLKTKSAQVVAMNVEQVCNEIKSFRHNLWTFTSDNGTEFINKHMDKVLEKNEMKRFTDQANSVPHTRTAIVERFNRTLRTIMSKALTLVGDLKWIRILDTIMDQYNDNVHSVTKQAPDDVLKYGAKPEKTKSEPKEIQNFELGDWVRYRMKRSKMSKASDPFWSREVHYITEINGNKIFINDKMIPYTQYQLIKSTTPEEQIQQTQGARRILNLGAPRKTIQQLEEELNNQARFDRNMNKEGVNVNYNDHNLRSRKRAKTKK